MRLVLAAALLMLCPTVLAAAVGPGDAAPDFELQDVNGTVYTLKGFAGRVVLLAFVGYG